MDETTAPTRAVQAALDALADARVSASLVIVALVAFLAWRLVLRRHRLASAPARPSMPRSFMHRLQSSPAVRALTARFSGRLGAAADAARARLRVVHVPYATRSSDRVWRIWGADAPIWLIALPPCASSVASAARFASACASVRGGDASPI